VRVPFEARPPVPLTGARLPSRSSITAAPSLASTRTVSSPSGRWPTRASRWFGSRPRTGPSCYWWPFARGRRTYGL